MRHQQASGPAVLRGEPFARPLQGDEVLRPIQIREWQVRRKPLLGDYETMLGRGLDPCALEQRVDRHSLERVIQPAPCRDAMDIAIDGLARKREKLIVGEREGFLDKAGNHERPLRRVDRRDITVMKDRPFGGGDLAGRDAVVSHAQAWARPVTALKRSAAPGPFFRMGSTPNALSNPLTTASRLRSHNVSR